MLVVMNRPAIAMNVQLPAQLPASPFLGVFPKRITAHMLILMVKFLRNHSTRLSVFKFDLHGITSYLVEII